MAIRDERIIGIIKEAAAKFLAEESSGASMITVTNVTLSNDAKYSNIFFTVFPIEKEKTALEFVKRKTTEFQEYMRENTRLGRVPFFEFFIDAGEKNRQIMDGIKL